MIWLFGKWMYRVPCNPVCEGAGGNKVLTLLKIKKTFTKTKKHTEGTSLWNKDLFDQNIALLNLYAGRYSISTVQILQSADLCNNQTTVLQLVYNLKSLILTSF